MKKSFSAFYSRNLAMTGITFLVMLAGTEKAMAFCSYGRAATYPDFALANQFATLNAQGEIQYEANYAPTEDRDADGVTNFQEWQGYEASVNGVLMYFGWRDTPLTSGALMPGSCLDQVDSDNDGASDFVERIVGTNPQSGDTDGDGMPDSWEIYVGLDPRDNGTVNPHNAPDADPDGDGLSNLEEMLGPSGLYPLPPAATVENPFTVRTPQDAGYTLPLNFDTDGDDLIDSFEYQNGHGLDPFLADEKDADPDRDGLTTFREQTVHPLLSQFWRYNNFPGAYRFAPPVFFSSAYYGGFARSGLVTPGYLNKANYNGPGDTYPESPGVVNWGHPVVRSYAGVSFGGTRRWTSPNNPDTDCINPLDCDFLPDGWEIEHGLNPLSSSPIQNNGLNLSGALGDPDMDGLYNLQEYFGADGYRIDFITGTGDESNPWILRAFNNSHRSDFASRIGQVGMGARGDQSPSSGYLLNFTNVYHPSFYPGFFDPVAFTNQAVTDKFRPVPGVPPDVFLTYTSFNPFATAITGILFTDTNGNGRYDLGEPLWLDQNGNGAYDPGEPRLAGPVPAAGPGLSIVRNHPVKYPMYGFDTDDDGLSDRLELIFDVTAGKVPTSPVQSYSPFIRRSARVVSNGGISTDSLNPVVEGRRFFSRSFTIESWVYLNDLGANDYRGSFAKGTVFLDGAGAFTRTGFDLGVEPATNGASVINSVPYFSFNTIADFRWKASAARSLPKNRWVHLAGTFDHTRNALSLYIDGVLEQSLQVLQESSATLGISYGGQLMLATNFGGTQSFATNLWIDEVRVWGVPRTVDEIADNYRRLVDVVQLAPTPPYSLAEPNTLFAYYTFDDGGRSAEDLVRRGKSSLLGYNFPRDTDVPTFLNQEYFYTDAGFALDSVSLGGRFEFDANRAAPVSGQIDPERGAFDSDRDGLPDDWEIIHEMNPFKKNSPDRDPISQYIPDYATAEGLTRDDLSDLDGDGLINIHEYRARTNPRKLDTDLNGIADGDEDFDEDGVPNRIEVLLNTRVDLADTDDDGFSDGAERASSTLGYSSESPGRVMAIRFDGKPGSFLTVPERKELRLSNWTIESAILPTADHGLANGQGASILRRVVQETTNRLLASTFELRVVNIGGQLYPEARYTHVNATGGGTTNIIRGIEPLVTSSGGYSLEQFTYMGATYDRITGAMTLYINGTARGLTNSPTLQPAISGRGPYVFTRIGEGFRGDIRDVRIWSRSLNPLEVRDIYLNGMMSQTNRPIVWFTMNDGGFPPTTPSSNIESDVIRSVRFNAAPVSPVDGDTWISGGNIFTYESGGARQVPAPAKVFREGSMAVGAAAVGDYAWHISRDEFFRFYNDKWRRWGKNKRWLADARAAVKSILTTEPHLASFAEPPRVGDVFFINVNQRRMSMFVGVDATDSNNWVSASVYSGDRFLNRENQQVFDWNSPSIGINFVTAATNEGGGFFIHVLDEGLAYRSDGASWRRWGYIPTVEDRTATNDWNNQWRRAATFRGNIQFIEYEQLPGGDLDSDGDGLPDWWEIANGLDPYDATGVNGADGDPDGDGLTNYWEYRLGLNPRLYDSFGDGIPDGERDNDGDGLTNLDEINVYGTDPTLWDTDNDGFNDFTEVSGRTDPLYSLSPLNSRVLMTSGHSNDYARFAPESRFALSNWVIEAWVYRTNSTSGDAEIIGRSTANGRYNYALGIRSDGRPEAKFTAPNGTVARILPPASLVIPLNQWTHLRGGFLAPSGSLFIEVDGVLYGQTNTLLRPDTGGATAMQTLVGRRFPGYIDEVRIWNRSPPEDDASPIVYPQTSGSAETLYSPRAFPRTGLELGLIGYLRFDDGVIPPGTPNYPSWAINVVEDFASMAGFQQWNERWIRSARLLNNASVIAAPPGTPSDVSLYIDRNGDGIPDWWQRRYWPDFDPNLPGTHPWSPMSDPDGDGLWNINEYFAGLNPLLVDTFADGILDGVRDSDGDGLSNLYEQNTSGTRVDLIDTDDDGITDWEEAFGRQIPPGWSPGDPLPPAIPDRVSNPIHSLDPPKKQSLRLNGNGHVAVNDQARHALRSWTIQAWVRPDAGADGIIIRRRAYNPLYGAWGINYELGVRQDGGAVRPYVRYSGFSTTGSAMPMMVDGTQTGEVFGGQLATTLIRNEEWTHLAATYDSDTSTLRLYINGVLSSYRTDALNPWGLGVFEDRVYRGEVRIGGGQTIGGVVTGGFEGYLDNVIIMAGSVDAEGVRRLANNANTLTASMQYSPTPASYQPIMVSVSEALANEHRENHIIVRFQEGITLSQAGTIAQNLGMNRIRSFELAPVHMLAIQDGSSLSQKLSQVRGHSSVLYAEPDYKLTPVRIPNDPSYTAQWALKNTATPGADISAEAAWDRTIGSMTPIVAVIDSGIDYTHGDLAANIWAGRGYDFFNGDDDPMDDHGHGTHVAGTIGAVGNNGLGIAGVNWRVRMMGLKFIGSFGFGFTSDAIDALQFAVANGARISNNSWGSYGRSQSLFDAINAAGSMGHLFIAAAGNFNFNNDLLPFYPASYELPNIISVAAMDQSGNRSTFSNYGRQSVHLGAPGSSILSTLPGNSYGLSSGTSMASPHVAGVAALILSQNPGMRYAAIRQLILSSVDARSNWENFVMTGGTLNAARAVGGSGSPVLFFMFDDGGQWVEDFTMEQNWNDAWFHAGRLVNDAQFSNVEFFQSNLDSNGDGIPDWWYDTYGFDPFGPSIAYDDPDGDGLVNLYEYLAGTHPSMPDSNMNGTLDGNEDPDGDGLTNLQEQMHGTHPRLADTDDDGIPDGQEITNSTSPLNSFSPENFRAMNFNGNGRLLVRTERDIDDHMNWTLEAWVKPNSSNENGIIIRRAEAVPLNNTRWIDYELGLSNNVPYILYSYRQGASLITERVNGIRRIGAQWTHLAAVHDEVDHQLRLYVNGKRVNFRRPAIRPPVTAYGIFQTTIGGGDRSGSTIAQAFRGQIDAVRIWDYARTGLEIQTSRGVLLPEFNDGRPDANRAPIRIFNFDDGGVYAENNRYTNDWMTGWIHAAALQGNVTWVAAPFPPLSLDSDDDSVPDQVENTSAWAINRSESPFVYRAISFDGNGDVYVDELVDNDEIALYALTNWTLEAWVRPTQLPLGMAPLIQRRDKATGRVTFELGLVNNGGVVNPYTRFQRDDAGNEFVSLSHSTVVPVGSGSNQWTHVASSFSNGVFSLFVNGARIQFNNVLGARPYVGGPGYVILGSTNFHGQLQEVRIWNDTRSPMDIANNYRSSLLFSSALLESSFQGGGSYLGRNTSSNENGLAYDYTTVSSYEGIPYLAGRLTHKFVVESWVRLEPGSSGGIVAERKIDVLLRDNEPDWRINHSLRITPEGQPQAVWMGEVVTYVPVREEVDDGDDDEGAAASVVVRLDTIQEVITRSLTSEVDLRDGAWHHVAMVGDSRRIRMYIDGNLDREASSYYVFKAREGESFEGYYFTYLPNNSVLRIGDDNFDGLIDEVMFWNEDISQQDVGRHMMYGLDKADIKSGLAPIEPLPAFAIDPGQPRQRLVSYVTFDGELNLPFVPDRANDLLRYRILPQTFGSEIVNPSTPPILVDRVRTFERQLRGYFAAVDGGEHLENYMERNDFGHAGLLRGNVSFLEINPLSIVHLITDSDGDGMPDWWESLYGLDPGSNRGVNGPWGDPDGDGLHNLAEFLSGTNPRNFDTAGDGFPDYDSRAPDSVRTWGEIYTDSDGMADAWEALYPDMMSPLQYDADNDGDGDGWSNFAEFMASTDPSDVLSRPIPQIPARILYSGPRNQGPLVVHIFSDASMNGVPDAVATAGATLPQSGVVGAVEESGIVARGALFNTPVVPGTAVISVGCPPQTSIIYEDLGNGVLRSMDVIPVRFGQIDYQTGDWNVSLQPTRLEAELPVCAVWRYFFGAPEYPLDGVLSVIRGYVRPGPAWMFAFIDNGNDATWNPGEPAGLLQQQPVNISWGNLPPVTIGLTDALPGYPRFEWDGLGSNIHTVRMRRTTSAGMPIIIDRIIRERTYFHEGDYQHLGMFGLHPGDSDLPGYQAFVRTTTNNISIDWRPELTTPVLVSPQGTVVYAKNDFVWMSHVNTVENRLQIRRGSTTGSVVFDRQFPAPHRHSDGRYAYTLPLYAGDTSLTNGVYYWRVVSINPRKSSDYSAWQHFAINLTDSPSGAYTISGNIHYFGRAPATSVVVQAYRSAGFSGSPDAQVTLTGIRQYKLQGLRAGTYHVVAFIDQNGNKKLDSWESWGFVKDYIVGNDYTVQPISVPGNKLDKDLVLRDRDTNNNGIPDAWEVATFGGLTANPSFVDSDGDGLSDWEELFVWGTNPYNPDTSGDGIRDGRAVALGLNPLLLDSDGDGYSDAIEIVLGSNPADAASIPPTADLFEVNSIVFGANRDVVTYDFDPAVTNITTNLVVNISAAHDLHLPFIKLNGSERSIFRTNWFLGPWVYTNTPPQNMMQFYRIDWKIKSN